MAGRAVFLGNRAKNFFHLNTKISSNSLKKDMIFFKQLVGLRGVEFRQASLRSLRYLGLLGNQGNLILRGMATAKSSILS